MAKFILLQGKASPLFRYFLLLTTYVLAGAMPLHGHGAPQPTNFSGVWETTDGLMRIMQEGKEVKGCCQFEDGQAEFSGTVTENVMKLNYVMPTGITGSGEFTFKDENKFTGTWKAKGSEELDQWKGTRVPPVAERKWLIVLEAHWEEDLQEPEYSYGGMLRQFFSRVPSVTMRHRFFDGKKDFATWCAELPYINEPMVLYVSSHGDEEGITVGDDVLTGKFIGKQLRYAPEIQLVHLGACLTMVGEVPAALRKASGMNFPVSGFTLEADWAGSAVTDFSYLDLVLSRDIPPKEAVRQIRKNIAFAREDESIDCDIGAVGLKIVNGD